MSIHVYTLIPNLDKISLVHGPSNKMKKSSIGPLYHPNNLSLYSYMTRLSIVNLLVNHLSSKTRKEFEVTV